MEQQETRSQEMSNNQDDHNREDIWDDSALVNAYNSAVQGYMKKHNPNYVQQENKNKNRNKKQKKSHVSSNQNQNQTKVNETKMSEGIQEEGEIASETTNTNKSKEEVKETETKENTSEQTIDTTYYGYYNYNYPTHTHPYFPPAPFSLPSGESKIEPAPDAPAIPDSMLMNDQALAQLLKAWYTTGYYTGYYQAMAKQSQAKK